MGCASHSCKPLPPLKLPFYHVQHVIYQAAAAGLGAGEAEDVAVLAGLSSYRQALAQVQQAAGAGGAGFGGTCGSTLFFDPPHRDWIAVAMGAFDGPTGVKITHHIYCADKGDFYDITDGLPQNAQ